MQDHSAATAAGISPAPGAKLEPDAIGAAQDTITWVLTSYIVAQAIATPITGWPPFTRRTGATSLSVSSVI